MVEEKDDGFGWHFTGFHGSPVEQQRKESWNLIKRLHEGNFLPWIMMGDFYELIFSFEKKGGKVREERQMAAFRETLEECDLNDIRFTGQWFTWERGNLANNNIRERLDRSLANADWRTRFNKLLSTASHT